MPPEVPAATDPRVTWSIPAIDGLLSAEQVADTARSIARMQEPHGAIPWTVGEHTDVWNHVEGAMALLVGGEVDAAERAYDWVLRTQRADGSWPMKIVNDVVEDHSSETNMSAYLAVGVWHHWLLRQDRDFVTRYWPVVRAGLDYVVSLQLPFGGIAWSQEWVESAEGERVPGPVNAEALIAGSSSIFHALSAGLALGELLDDPQPGWEQAARRLRHALREHPEMFLDKAEFSMDWYYPVLGGVVRGSEGLEMINKQWDTFVVPGLGIKCVSKNPWVTGAETSELVMALDALGDDERASAMLREIQHLREDDGRYWTGYVYPEDVRWPGEQTTYTAAAVVLAVDALARSTPASGIMRGDTLPELTDLVGDCGC